MQDLQNAFSKSKIFNEKKYNAIENTELATLLDSIKVLIDNERHSDIIEKHITKNALKKLFIELFYKYTEEKKMYLMKKRTDTIIEQIQEKLELETSIPRIKRPNLSSIIKNRIMVDKFNNVINILKSPKTIESLEEHFYDFSIQVNVHEFTNVTELKNSGKISNAIAIKEEFDKYYETDPHTFIREINTKGVPESDLYRCVLNVNLTVRDDSGQKISGGQKAEFVLLRQLSDATNYDILLIDEPEASFDNIFLKDRVISRIKQISKSTTTFVTTHNNSLGVLMNPDKIIYTYKDKENNYELYTGTLTSKEFKSVNGQSLPSYNTILDIMEAGEKSYEQRERIYKTIKNRK